MQESKKEHLKVNWKGYSFPSRLFYSIENKPNFVSPAANFNPNAALGGNGFESSTTPNAEPKPKKLILTVDVFKDYHSPAQWFALIKWFEDHGFTLYLFLGEKGRELLPCKDLDAIELYQSLKKLSGFNPKFDYEILAQHNIPPAHAAVLTELPIPDKFTRFISQDDVLEMNSYMAIRPSIVGDTHYSTSGLTSCPRQDFIELCNRENLELDKDQLIKKTIRALTHDTLRFRAFINYLKLFPQYASSILSLLEENDLINLDFDQISEILSACPNEETQQQAINYLRSTQCQGLFECIAKHPDKMEALIALAINNKLLEKSISSVTIDNDLGQKIAKILLPHAAKIQSIALLDFMIRHTPECEERLILIEAAKDFGVNMPSNILKLFPESFDSYKNTLRNGFRLASLIQAFPDKAEELISNYAKVINWKSSPQIKLCFESSPIAARYLFENFYHELAQSEYHSEGFPSLARWLILDEDKISNGFLLAYCLQEFPQQAERLIKKHAHKISSDNFGPCYKALPNLETKKQLIELFIKTIENSGNEEDKQFLKDRLFATSQYDTVISSWLLEQYPSLINDLYFDPFFRTAYSSHFDLVMQFKTPYEHTYLEDITERRRLQGFIDRHDTELLPRELYHLPQQKVDELPLQETYYLYLGDTQDIKNYIEAIKQGKLKKLTVLEITHAKRPENLKEFFSALQEHCPNLKLLLLPPNLKSLGTHLPYMVEYQKEIWVQKPNQSSTEQLFIPRREKNSTKPIYINAGKTNLSLSSKATSASYDMVATGELLNGEFQQPQRIRTAVLTLSDDFSQAYSPKPKLTEIDRPTALSPEDIEKFKQKNNGFCYYQFKTQLKANQLTRLLSVDAQEQLRGITNKEEIQFWRGDDGFYYALAKKDCLLNYVVKSVNQAKQQADYAAIPHDDPIKKIIKDYKSSIKYKDIGSEDSVPPTPTNKKDRIKWLDDLYEQRAGVCRHRCYAVWHKIRQDSSLASRVRLVDIDKNHVRLEIKYGDQWHQVDLGGSLAQLNYDANKTSENTTVEAIEISATPAPTSTSTPNIVPKKKKKAIIDDSEGNSTAQNERLAAEMPADQLAQQAALRRLVYQAHFPKPLATHNELIEEVLQNTESPVLVVNPNLQAQANLILKEAQNFYPSIFYLDSSRYGHEGEQTRISPEGQPFISKLNDLDWFLQAIEKAPSALLLINWDAFTAQERVAINTAIDRKKTIYGRPLPDHLKIISLTAKQPTDKSFLTRHHQQFHANFANEPTTVHSDKTVTLDAQGFPDWQRFLFGPVVLVNNKLEWKHGPLTKRLLNYDGKEPLNIALQNLPTEAINMVNHLAAQAKAEGVVRYLGYELKWPANLNLQVATQEFDFTPFPSVPVVENVTLDNCPNDSKLVNSILFDYLLSDKKIKDGQYQPLPGWLKQAKNQELPLFISTQLSLSQWYCLFKQAEKYHVDLKLYLAPEVRLPDGLQSKPLTEALTKTKTISNHIIVSNEPETLAQQLENDDTLCFAVEDYNYQDLIASLDYEYSSEQGFHDFNKQKSALIQALKKDGKNVVLYGEFSQELLQALAPKITKNRKGKLTLLIEDKEVNENAEIYPSLSWLPREAYQLKRVTPPETKPAPVIHESTTQPDWLNINLKHSEVESEAFIQRRIDTLTDLFEQFNMVQLIGPTAVGKSHLIEELKKKHQDEFEVYHELEQFEDWANDDSGKTKILFIDESNISNQHLTLFNPLKKGGPSIVLFKGKLFELSPNHKVVFARNPHDYGGGRNEQKLFKDQQIPEFHLNEMPPAFIYERMLRPISSHWGKKKGITEPEFKGVATQYLQKYHSHRSNGKAIAARKLQEWVLKDTLQHCKKTKLFSEEKFSSHFIPTPSTTPLRLSLAEFLRIRKRQGKYDPLKGSGLNSFLIEGRPGIGKSELILHTLETQGYQAKNPRDVSKKEGKFYYKIDANLSLKAKEKILSQAFEEGNGVWLDEVNSCIEDGLEKLLNSLLSGIHPKTGKQSNKGGFFAVLTANSLGMEGRSLIGPALRARSIQKNMPEPLEKDFKAIIQGNLLPEELEKTDVDSMAAGLARLFKDDQSITLREIKPKLSAIAEIYPKTLVAPNPLPTVQVVTKEGPDHKIEREDDRDSQTKLRELINNQQPQKIREFLNQNSDTTEGLKSAMLDYAVSKENKLKEIAAIIHCDKPPTEETIKLAILGSKAHNNNNYAIFLKNALNCRKYSDILDENSDPLAQAKALLNDYTRGYSRFQRIIHGNWRHHHVKAVNKLVNDAKDMKELLKGFNDDISLKNQTGSLARRIHYIQYVIQEGLEDEAQDLGKSSIWETVN